LPEWEKKGLSLTGLKEMGFMIIIRKVEIHYKFPAMAGNELIIRTTLKEYRKTNGTFHQKIFRRPDEKLIAEADVNWVVVNLEGKPVRIPAIISEAFSQTKFF
jgi:YbgC/YbaW family acyl-CoA thioester hydrolase